jgi:thioredoxin 1
MFHKIKLSIASITLAIASVATPALAGEFAPVSMAAYQAAVAKNRPIIFHVRTKDGPVCNAQHAVLAKLMAEPAFADYVVFEADFTANPAAVKMLRVDTPSTLIFSRGATELGRATGLTEEADIRTLVTRVAR